MAGITAPTFWMTLLPRCCRLRRLRRCTCRSKLARQLRCDRRALDDALQLLAELRWAGPLATPQADVAPVHVLLIDPAATPLAPLIERMLLARNAATERLWRAAGWQGTSLGAVLQD